VGEPRFGRHVGRPTQNVLIEGCTSSSPDGAIVFGSEVRKAPSWPRLSQLQPFIAVFPQERVGQLASVGPT
jgi:hypothetical protein